MGEEAEEKTPLAPRVMSTKRYFRPSSVRAGNEPGGGTREWTLLPAGRKPTAAQLSLPRVLPTILSHTTRIALVKTSLGRCIIISVPVRPQQAVSHSDTSQAGIDFSSW